jgi:hypothetical protein
MAETHAATPSSQIKGVLSIYFVNNLLLYIIHFITSLRGQYMWIYL